MPARLACRVKGALGTEVDTAAEVPGEREPGVWGTVGLGAIPCLQARLGCRLGSPVPPPAPRGGSDAPGCTAPVLPGMLQALALVPVACTCTPASGASPTVQSQTLRQVRCPQVQAAGRLGNNRIQLSADRQWVTPGHGNVARGTKSSDLGTVITPLAKHLTQLSIHVWAEGCQPRRAIDKDSSSLPPHGWQAAPCSWLHAPRSPTGV